MKKILFITAFVPSKIGAGVNYTRQTINDLAINNKIDLVLFKYKADEEYVLCSKNVSLLKVFKHSRILKFLNVILFPFLHPLFTSRFNIFRLFALKRQLKQKDYDLVYFDFSQTFIFAKFFKEIPKVLMSHDVITQRYSRLNNKPVELFCKLTERFVLNVPNSTIFTFSEKDKELIREKFNLESKVTCFYIEPSIIKAYPTKLNDSFVFFAMWKRKDNSDGFKWFLEKVYPSLTKQYDFKVIGDGLDKKLIEGCENIEYLGFVENPYPYIANSKALIVPLFTGAGVKVKVIDSLACGTPVIGTHVAFEGISNNYSKFMIKANSNTEFINQITNFKITKNQKIDLKNHFLETYPQMSIGNFINNNIK